jgi:hypothetical protein
VSDPTYRIDVEHVPGETMPWRAHIVRLSDEAHVYTKVWETSQGAVERACAWIAEQTVAQPGFSLYVDDDGRPVEAHSLKAS